MAPKSSVARSELKAKLEEDLNYAFENPSSMGKAYSQNVVMGTFVLKIGNEIFLSEYQRQDSNWCAARKFGFIMAVCKGTADLQFTFLEMSVSQHRRVTRATSDDTVMHTWDGGHRCHTLHAFVIKNEPVFYSSSNIPLFFKEPTVGTNPTFFRKVTDKTTLPDGTWSSCVMYQGSEYVIKDMSYTVFSERQQEKFLQKRTVTELIFDSNKVTIDDMSKYIVDRHLGQKPEQGEIIQTMLATKTPALDALDEILQSNEWITTYFANKAVGVEMLSYMLCSVHEDTKQASTTWFHHNIFSFFLPKGVFALDKKAAVVRVFEHFRPIATASTLAQTTSKTLVFHATVAMGFALALYWESCPEWLDRDCLNTYLNAHADRKGEKLPSFIHIAKEFVNRNGELDNADSDDDADDADDADADHDMENRETRVVELDSDDDDIFDCIKRPRLG